MLFDPSVNGLPSLRTVRAYQARVDEWHESPPAVPERPSPPRSRPPSYVSVRSSPDYHYVDERDLAWEFAEMRTYYPESSWPLSDLPVLPSAAMSAPFRRRGFLTVDELRRDSSEFPVAPQPHDVHAPPFSAPDPPLDPRAPELIDRETKCPEFPVPLCFIPFSDDERRLLIARYTRLRPRDRADWVMDRYHHYRRRWDARSAFASSLRSWAEAISPTGGFGPYVSEENLAPLPSHVPDLSSRFSR